MTRRVTGIWLFLRGSRVQVQRYETVARKPTLIVAARLSLAARRACQIAHHNRRERSRGLPARLASGVALGGAGHSHGLDEIVDRAGPDASDAGLLDDGSQRLLGHAPGLEEARMSLDAPTAIFRHHAAGRESRRCRCFPNARRHYPSAEGPPVRGSSASLRAPRTPAAVALRNSRRSNRLRYVESVNRIREVSATASPRSSRSSTPQCDRRSRWTKAPMSWTFVMKTRSFAAASSSKA